MYKNKIGNKFDSTSKQRVWKGVKRNVDFESKQTDISIEKKSNQYHYIPNLVKDINRY